MIWHEIVKLWASGTRTQRLRLAVLLLLTAVLLVMVVDLVGAAWLELAETTAQVIQEALT
jgi:hypothetical protein